MFVVLATETNLVRNQRQHVINVVQMLLFCFVFGSRSCALGRVHTFDSHALRATHLDVEH